MPELPEVETIRRSLEPLLVGLRIEQVEIFDRRLVRPEEPAVVAAQLSRERIVALQRRGKYLLFRFESGRSLVAHLRMTGSFRAGESGSLGDDPYRRALVGLSNGVELAYRDVRRFGTWLILEEAELGPYLSARVGPEPLSGELTAAVLLEHLAGRESPIKAALLNQRTLAGLGNIYVDEALWQARLHPARHAGSLRKEAIERLHAAIIDVLETGIARQGATLRDYALPDGERGSMQAEFHVYGRAGEPCDRCGKAIVKTRVAGRGTWFCPRCQRCAV